MCGRSARRELVVEIIHDCEHPTAITSWLALEGASNQPDFFQSFRWCSYVARIRTHVDPTRYRPLVAIAFAGSKPVALWPLSRQKGALISLCNLDDPFGQFAGLLSAYQSAADVLVARTLSHVKERGLADLARIERVIKGSPLEGALLASGISTRPSTEAPYLDLAGCESFSQLKLARNKKTMKNLRNATNRLRREGDLTAVVSAERDDFSRIAKEAFANREAWLIASGRTAPAFRSPAYREIVGGAEAAELDGVRLGFELRSNGTSIAQQIGYVHRGRYYACLSGMDPSKHEFMPGKIHLGLVIEEVLARGLEGIEFLSPASDYKLTWTKTVRELADATVGLSRIGRLRLYSWDAVARPILKRLFYCLPVTLRRLLLTPRFQGKRVNAHGFLRNREPM